MTELATLAGGCFWGVEELFRQQPGVISTIVGYTGGQRPNPIYEQVKTGVTGHAEAIQVSFDPTKTSFRDILLFFFKMHDPTTLNRQQNDRGTQYRSAIFYHDATQKQCAIDVISEAQKQWPAPIVTAVEPASTFFEAEAYHQKYLVKNPDGYNCHYVRK